MPEAVIVSTARSPIGRAFKGSPEDMRSDDLTVQIRTTLINSLQFHDKQFGLETMRVGGGQGMAMTLERLS